MANPECKKAAKKVMPFVQFVKDNVTRAGAHAMDLTPLFNEGDVYDQLTDYFSSTLNVSKVTITNLDDSDNAALLDRVAPLEPCLTFL